MEAIHPIKVSTSLASEQIHPKRLLTQLITLRLHFSRIGDPIPMARKSAYLSFEFKVVAQIRLLNLPLAESVATGRVAELPVILIFQAHGCDVDVVIPGAELAPLARPFQACVVPVVVVAAGFGVAGFVAR